MNILSFRDCIGLSKVDRQYYVSKTDINPATGKMYAVNPSSGNWDDNYWAQNEHLWNPSTPSTPSTTGVSNATSDVTAGANQQQQNFDNFLTTAKGSVTDAITKYGNDTTSAITTANNTFKIPQQTSIVNALSNRINTLSGNTDNSGAGGFASADQVDAALNTRYLPQFSQAVGNLNTSEQAAQAQENLALAPDVANVDSLTKYIATAMSGFGTNEKEQLSALLGKLDAGVTLSQTELDNANRLAVAQEGYNQAIDSIKQNQLTIPVSQYSTLYDAATGKIVNPGVLAASGSYTP